MIDHTLKNVFFFSADKYLSSPSFNLVCLQKLFTFEKIYAVELYRFCAEAIANFNIVKAALMSNFYERDFVLERYGNSVRCGSGGKDKPLFGLMTSSFSLALMRSLSLSHYNRLLS